MSENGRCYSILGNLNAYTKDTGACVNNKIGYAVLGTTVKEKDSRVTISADKNVQSNRVNGFLVPSNFIKSCYKSRLTRLMLFLFMSLAF